MTNREKVLKLLKETEELSCYQLVMGIIRSDKTKIIDQYSINNMNASLSGTLNRMVKREEIEVSPNKAIRGGKMYKLKFV